MYFFQSLNSTISLCRPNCNPEGDRNWFVSLTRNIYWKQLIVILIVNAITTFGIVMLNNAWIVPVVTSHDNDILKLDAKLSHEAQVSDENIHDTVLERIEQLERNMTDRLAQLRNDYATALTEVQEEWNGDLHNAMYRMSEVESELSSARAAIAVLNSTKASRVNVERLTSELDARKVDKAEFEILSHDLTLLRESTTREDEEIREDIDELSDSALNQTHYDQLQDGIDRLEESKADQTALEELDSTVNELTNSTMKLQRIFWELALNVTTLEQHTSEALATKADQRDIDSLSDRLTALSDTTVTTETFERLEDRVETLSTNKAEQSDLNELKGTVDHLDATCARKYKVDQLEGRVTSHITSSDDKHEELASDISDNDGSIQINSRRIGNVENAIQQDDTETSAASHVLTSSWMITIVTLVTITINTCV